MNSNVHPDFQRKVGDLLKSKRVYLEEVEQAKQIAEKAKPGEWRVRNGTVCRFDGEHVQDAESLAFMAKARCLVPALARMVADMVDLLANQVSESHHNKASFLREREHREADFSRMAKGGRSETDLYLIVEALENCKIMSSYARELITQWADGATNTDMLRAHLRNAPKREDLEARVKELALEIQEVKRAKAEEIVAEQLRLGLVRAKRKT